MFPFSPHHAHSPHLSPPPILEPTPFGFVHVSFYTCSLLALPLFSPIIPLPCPLWLLTVCSLFQCLWLYFACLFVALIRFHLYVRPYGIYLSPTLISLSIMLSSSIHAVMKCRSSFFFLLHSILLCKCTRVFLSLIYWWALRLLPALE